jgi:hypothetical protein
LESKDDAQLLTPPAQAHANVLPEVAIQGTFAQEPVF